MGTPRKGTVRCPLTLSIRAVYHRGVYWAWFAEEVRMYGETPPPWPDRPPQPPGSGAPQSRNRFLLALVAMVAGVLIAALVGTLVLILARGAQGSGAIGEQSSSAATATAAAGTVTSGQPTSATATATLPKPTPTNTP